MCLYVQTQELYEDEHTIGMHGQVMVYVRWQISTELACMGKTLCMSDGRMGEGQMAGCTYEAYLWLVCQ